MAKIPDLTGTAVDKFTGKNAGMLVHRRSTEHSWSPPDPPQQADRTCHEICSFHVGGLPYSYKGLPEKREFEG